MTGKGLSGFQERELPERLTRLEVFAIQTFQSVSKGRLGAVFSIEFAFLGQRFLVDHGAFTSERARSVRRASESECRTRTAQEEHFPSDWVTLASRFRDIQNLVSFQDEVVKARCLLD